MKIIRYSTGCILSICCLFFLYSCGGSSGKSDGFSFSASTGVKMDLGTGTKTSYSGFSVDEIHIVDAEDQALGGNEIPINTKFSIVYDGIENYTLKDGKAFPGLSLQVADEAGNYILNETDLFSSYTEGFPPADASVLRGSVTVADPMKAGVSYHCTLRVFDKNSDAEIISELDFAVIE